jgi:tRNA threonylcarbamoyladenosine biosynthesis protein TsaB
MTILALEFSSERRSAALARDGRVLAEATETGGRGTNAFALIETVLAEAKIAREAVEAIAVGLGPGSYTGIRATIAVAQGWQLARGVKLLGINSVEALAAQAQVAEIYGRVHIVIDAQRGEFYLATWEIFETGRTEIATLKIVPAAEIETLRDAGETLIGPEMNRRMFPAAAQLAHLASGRTNFIAGEKLEPIYLRETTFVKSPPPQRQTA